MSKTRIGTVAFVVFASACVPGAQVNTGGAGGKASEVTFVNCTIDNNVGEPVSGRAYNVVARLKGGTWGTGQLLGANPTGTIAPCDSPDPDAGGYKPPSVTVQFDQAGTWEVHAIRIQRDGDQPCSSNNEDADDVCTSIDRTFDGDPTASPAPTIYFGPADE